MNETDNPDSKRKTFKSVLPQIILGALAGGVGGFFIGSAVAPLVSTYLVKPSPLVLDPSAIIVSLLVIGLLTLAGAIVGAYIAVRLTRNGK